MTELETIQRAKVYIDKLANGINPIDDTAVPETDVINNVRIARCLFYVSTVLGRMIEESSTAKNEKPQKKPFTLTAEELKKFKFSETPISISEIAKRLNTLIDQDTMKKISYMQIREWLLQIELLKEVELPSGKCVKRPTKSGTRAGISLETRKGRDGVYTVVLYDRDAQQFIVDNLQVIL